MEEIEDDLEVKYFLSSDIELDIKVKILRIDGKIPQDLFQQATLLEYSETTHTKNVELYIEGQLYCDLKPIGLHVCTAFRCFEDTTECHFDQWLTIPLKYSNLSPVSHLALTVWNVIPNSGTAPSNGHRKKGESPVGSCLVPLFDENGVLLSGEVKIPLEHGIEAQNTAFTSKHIPQVTGKKQIPVVPWLDKLTVRRLERIKKVRDVMDELSLVVEFPYTKYPVLFNQKEVTHVVYPSDEPSSTMAISFMQDPESMLENPVEAFHLMLDDSESAVTSAKSLKPLTQDKAKIVEILRSPNADLKPMEKRLLMKFRYSLVDNKRALSKFLRCVDWRDANEASQAVALLDQWVDIDIAVALELLSADFEHPDVRKFGVRVLSRADDEEFSCYLLQLAQALRFETNFPNQLSDFLKKRVMTSFQLVNYYHWYLTVARSDTTFGHMYKKALDQFKQDLQMTTAGREYLMEIAKQHHMVEELLHLSADASSVSRRVDRRIERMRDLLGTEMKNLQHFKSPVVMPVRPDFTVTGIVKESAFMFKSALAPLGLTFNVDQKMPDDPDKFKVIFKVGDNLTQDQMVIQTIRLMDQLFKRVNLDLQLTPYAILSTSLTDGFIEFVPESSTIASILKNYNQSINEFLRAQAKTDEEYEQFIKTFVRSSAGYCIITYVLGIGDRHLDNLMITKSGNLFHIDFGFIFGNDPKPFPPPMKLCKEMVECMQQDSQDNYKEFEVLSCQAFNILRKNARLILSLLSLTGDMSPEFRNGLRLVEQNFRLDLSDTKADQYVLQLLNDSVTALFPKLVEKVHTWATYWR